MGWLSWCAIGFACLIIPGILITMAVARKAPRPEDLGITNGRLAACLRSGNCVSSQDGLSPPFRYNSTEEIARQRLQEIVFRMFRGTIVANEANYLSVLFRSPFFGFIDDAEFQFSTHDRIIHFRSGARQGRFDFHVNRTRIEAIRAEFEDFE